jgi:hypothetical protein
VFSIKVLAVGGLWVQNPFCRVNRNKSISKIGAKIGKCSINQKQALWGTNFLYLTGAPMLFNLASQKLFWT